jgi:dienelactone hydrolase
MLGRRALRRFDVDRSLSSAARQVAPLRDEVDWVAGPLVMGRVRRLLVVVMLTSIAFVQAGCGGSHPGPVRGVVLATPASGVFDQPVHVVVSHVRADRELTVRLQSVDATGTLFSAQATVRSNGAGQVDLASAPAIGGGFYAGVDPMGLIDAMQPASGGTAPYHWKGAQPQRFDVTVSEGTSRVASGGFTRRGVAPGVTVRPESIAATGFYGQFWAPPRGTPRHAGVLEFGGSEGGLHGQLIGAALASAGYPTLDIAYFGELGLPATLKDIPLEYFARALRWLDRQPEVLKGQTYVLGGSRGSEAALLLGAHYPPLVHGVIASSPSDVSFGSYPRAGSAAWTFHGRAVPYTRAFISPNVPADDPAAAIPVQDIRGPVFLDCGTDDHLWTSCAYALRIEHHLTAARFAYPHVLYRYLGAGHYVNLLVPYQPGEILSDLARPTGQGNTLLANANAHARLWAQLLGFLAHPEGHTGVITAPSTPPPLTPRSASR